MVLRCISCTFNCLPFKFSLSPSNSWYDFFPKKWNLPCLFGLIAVLLNGWVRWYWCMVKYFNLWSSRIAMSVWHYGHDVVAFWAWLCWFISMTVFCRRRIDNVSLTPRLWLNFLGVAMLIYVISTSIAFLWTGKMAMSLWRHGRDGEHSTRGSFGMWNKHFCELVV